MSATPVDLGRFPGGMNNVAELSTIDDDQLSLIVNMELDTDGSLKTRPALVADVTTLPGTSSVLTPLGWYIDAAGTAYLVVSAAANGTWLYQPDARTWTQLVTWAASGYVQYDNKAVLCRESAAGGYWEAGVWTDTSSMPKLSKIVVYKERFYGIGPAGTADATTVYFSNTTVISPPTTIYTWTVATDYFTVGLGDGEQITNIVADLAGVFIFKERSSYVFDFATSPRSGTLRQISATLGCENKDSIVAYEGSYYLFCNGFLYQFVNQRFYPLNTKRIRFERAAYTNDFNYTVRVSLFGTRIMVWYYGNLYVYSLIQQAWSTWESPTSRAGWFFQLPSSAISSAERVALAVTGVTDAAARKMWRIDEDPLATGSGETINWMIRTKAYAYGEYGQYKRMFHVLAAIRSSSGAQIGSYPVAIPTGAVTWDDLATKTWDELALGTWDNPLIIPVEWESDVAFPTAQPTRAVIRARAPFRFLQAYHEIAGDCDGTTGTSPARIYSVTVYVSIKSHVSKAVS